MSKQTWFIDYFKHVQCMKEDVMMCIKAINEGHFKGCFLK
jgi:hypothetical protein